MVALTGMPAERTTEEENTAPPSETSVYWGRISSMSATKVPAHF